MANGVVALLSGRGQEPDTEQQAQSFLYFLQGNEIASVRLAAKSATEFALAMIPAGRAGAVAKVGEIAAGEGAAAGLLSGGTKASASTVGSTAQNGEAATGLLSTQLAKDAKSYLTDIQSLTGRQFTPQQLELLKADLRENTYSRLSIEEVKLNRAEFNDKLPSLRAEWEKIQARYGQKKASLIKMAI
jgi:hypothetical protein